MQSLCKRLGLDAKETQVFLTLMQLGAQPVSIIAKQTGLPRTSLYYLLDHLKQLRLIDEFERKGMKYVKCIPAKDIQDVLRSRERDIELTMTLLEEKLPELQALESTLSITPTVKFYEGKEEVKSMYSQIVQESSFCAFVDLAAVKDVMPEYYDEIPKMIKQKGGMARELAVVSDESLEYMNKYSSKRHQIKILPKHMKFPSDVIVCKDHLYMTAYGEQQISAVQIFSESLAQTQQVLFDYLWDSV